MREEWIDEGTVDAAQGAARRARTSLTSVSAPPTAAPSRRRPPRPVDQDTAATIRQMIDPARAERAKSRLEDAAGAVERGRFDDARRMIQPVLRDLPDLAAAHEVAGLAEYGAGRWRSAVRSLERAHELDDSNVGSLPMLADSYRALRRYAEVERLWAELRGASPHPSILAEGRIVAAGAQADQGRLTEAIATMQPATRQPKRVEAHHLRQWYVLADLYDRNGDVLNARRLFGWVRAVDPAFADVGDRLAGLGR